MSSRKADWRFATSLGLSDVDSSLTVVTYVYQPMVGEGDLSMANYAADGNRWTAIFQANPIHGTGEFTYTRLPWEIVRFNVDTNPSSPPLIVPIGEERINAANDRNNSPKIYERVWIVDNAPFGLGSNGKTYFGPPA
jgi:hypothetical protein